MCLPDQTDLLMDLTERTGLTAGWGATAVTHTQTRCDFTKGVTVPGSVSPVLKKIEGLQFKTLKDCHRTFDEIFSPGCPSARISEDEPVHICATSPTADICNGDSGGGLVILDNEKK